MANDRHSREARSGARGAVPAGLPTRVGQEAFGSGDGSGGSGGSQGSEDRTDPAFPNPHFLFGAGAEGSVSGSRSGGSPGLASRISDAAAARLLIYDQLPSSQRPRQDDRVLLLGHIWGGETMVALEQVPTGGDLKLSRLVDLPDSGLPGDFLLVRHQGGELVFTVPSTLKAEVHNPSAGKPQGMKRLLESGRALPIEAPFAGAAYQVQLDDRVVVQLAPQLALIGRYVRADRQRDKSVLDLVDVPFASTLIVLLLLFGLLWLLLRLAPRSEDLSADDLARNQARFTKYLVQAAEVARKPKFKSPSGAKDAARNAAKDRDGRFGKQDGRKRDADPSRKGAPNLDANKSEKDRQVVMKTGLLAALSKVGAGLPGAASNVLGPGGIGNGINAALGGVKGGAGQADAYGVSGLGPRGSGSGGGTAQGIGSLGAKGDGKGSGGSGEIDLAGRGKEETIFVPGSTTVVGGLPREVINRVIQRHYNEIKYCYEKELSKDPGLYGKVTVLFVIEGNGRVGDALVQQTTMSSEPVETCIVNHVKRWMFPPPQGGGQVQVTYPYVFKSTGQ